jgi:two-component system, NarL family, response regulator DevR
MKVFIVEDSPLVVDRLLAMFAEFEGSVEVIGRADAADSAIGSIRALKPDAVVLDIRLARGTGLDVLEHVKRDEHPPIIMMLTNYPHPQYRRRCFEYGADYFLDKSTEFDSVRGVFKELLSGSPAGHA